MLSTIDWTRPWFLPFAASASTLTRALQGGDDLRAALNGMSAGALRNARGLPLRFIAQSALPDGVAYESHIDATGQVPTRDNLHDAFNALMWLHYPQTKQLLNRLQAEAIARDGVQRMRGGLRDAATLFDENGALLVTEDAGLAQALRGFSWHELFLSRRDAWAGACTVLPFGHALLEKLVNPYKAITAHVWWIAASPGLAMAQIDGLLAASLAGAAQRGALAGGRGFAPLPVMGVPGWSADNADPAFYDDAGVFRAGRRADPTAHRC